MIQPVGVALSLGCTLVLGSLSAGAIVAHVKEVDRRIENLEATVSMSIERGGESRERRFILFLRREGSRYEARIEVEQPIEMAGMKFLIHADRGKRNRQWTYFPDLELVRQIPGSQQDDSFLGSDLTYSDLAGAAHLDDLKHELLGEEMVSGAPCYHMRGTPKHDIAYGRLEGWISKKDFVTVQAQFFDRDLKLLKQAQVSDFRPLGEGILFGHTIVVNHAQRDSRTLLQFERVKLNGDLSNDFFSAENLAGS